MTQLSPRYTTLAIAGITSAFLAAPGMAWAINYANDLAWTSQKDTAPQRYETAVVKADGGLKVALQDCQKMAVHAERISCASEVKQR